MRAMNRVRICAIGVLATLALPGPVGPAESAVLKACERPILTSHMGSLPEGDGNTIPAYLGAVERGAEAIEMDVRRIRGGLFVMFHNPTVGSTTNGRGAISEMTLAQVQRLRTSRSHNRIPTLGETLATLAPHDVRLQIELKDPQEWPRRALPRFIGLIRHFHMASRVVFESADKATVARIHDGRPALDAAWKSLRVPWTPVSAARFTDGVVLNRHTDNFRRVHAMHALGLTAYSPRIREAYGWSMAVRLHTDTVMTFSITGYLEWCARQRS